MNWLQKGIDDYYKLLKDKTQISEDANTGWNVISTPVMGSFGDTIEVFVKNNKQDDTIIFSDDGNTIRNLELQGVSFAKSPKRKQILDRVLLTYGLSLSNKDNEIIAKVSCDKFVQKKYDMITAIAEINAFNILSKKNIGSLFKEDVKNYLDENNIVYTSEFISKGKTGLDFTFDFQVVHRDKEIVIKAFNSLNKGNITSFLFTWEDIKEIREKISGKPLLAIVIVNDSEKVISEDYLKAFQSKNTSCIAWTNRHQKESINQLKVA